MKYSSHLLFLLIFITTSCGKTFYILQDGVRYLSVDKRQNESPEEILVYLSQLKISYSESFLMIDSFADLLSTDSMGLNLHKIERQIAASPIQLRVYDQYGNLATGYSQCFGDFKRLNVLDTYPPRIIEHLPINMNLTFPRELYMFDISTSIKEDILRSTNSYDYTLVVYWNKWSKYYSRILLLEASKFFEFHNAHGRGIRLILVNTARDELSYE